MLHAADSIYLLKTSYFYLKRLKKRIFFVDQSFFATFSICPASLFIEVIHNCSVPSRYVSSEVSTMEHKKEPWGSTVPFPIEAKIFR